MAGNQNEWFERLKTWLPVVAVVTGIIIYIVHAEIGPLRTDLASLTVQLASAKDDISKLKDDGKNTNARIDNMLSDALKRAFPVPAAGVKPTKQQINAASRILELARAEQANIDPVVLKNVGENVAALTTKPQLATVAWDGLNQAVSYRSFLNKDYVPKFSDLTEITGTEDYSPDVNLSGPGSSGVMSGHALSVWYAGGHQPDKQSARMELLSKPRAHGSGIGFFIIDGGTSAIGLDGIYMKNVIVRNAVVDYDGGPIKLENVYFVNCTFRLKRTPAVRDFGTRMLQAAAISFDTTRVPAA
jgi:hypothetical protein